MLSQSLSNKSSPNTDAKNPGIAFISRNTFQIFHNLHHFRIIRHPRVRMSTPGTQKRRKQEGEKTRKRMPAESPRNKTSGKVRGGQAWVSLPSNPKLMVPVGKTEKYPEEIRDVLSPRPQGAVVGGLIAENTLYAVTVSVESIQLSEHCATANTNTLQTLIVGFIFR